jgi:hypothetical protein
VAAVDPLLGKVHATFPQFHKEPVLAHITVLYPFVPQPEITAADLDALGELFSAYRPLAVRFTELRRFPRLLYLDPEPAAPFQEMTVRAVARRPHLLPYGGKYGDSEPHLSVAGLEVCAEAELDAVTAAVQAEAAPLLPITTVLDEAWLVVYDGTRWNRVHRFGFSAP